MGIEVEKVKVRETEKYEMYNEAEYWSVCWNKGGEKRVFGGRGWRIEIHIGKASRIDRKMVVLGCLEDFLYGRGGITKRFIMVFAST